MIVPAKSSISPCLLSQGVISLYCPSQKFGCILLNLPFYSYMASSVNLFPGHLFNLHTSGHFY